jgi:putative transcriptional regulator
MKNLLRELRAAKQWSQGELAEKLGMSRQTINAIETQKYEPSLPLVFKMARLFKQPIEEIADTEPGGARSVGRGARMQSKARAEMKPLLHPRRSSSACPVLLPVPGLLLSQTQALRR